MNFNLEISEEEIIGLIKRAKLVERNTKLLEQISPNVWEFVDKLQEETLLWRIMEQLCPWDEDAVWELVYDLSISPEETYRRIVNPTLEELGVE